MRNELVKEIVNSIRVKVIDADMESSPIKFKFEIIKCCDDRFLGATINTFAMSIGSIEINIKLKCEEYVESILQSEKMVDYVGAEIDLWNV